MGRFLVATATVGAFMVAMSAPAWAFQCPKLVKQVEDEAGQRFDDASYSAQKSAAEATALHKAGKHAEAEAKAKEAKTLLGLK